MPNHTVNPCSLFKIVKPPLTSLKFFSTRTRGISRNVTIQNYSFLTNNSLRHTITSQLFFINPNHLKINQTNHKNTQTTQTFTFYSEIVGELDMLMCKPTSSTQLAAFLFVDSRWHEPHDAVQCRAHGSTFKFLIEFQTEFFSNFFFLSFKLFENQTVRLSRVHCICGVCVCVCARVRAQHASTY